MNNKNIGKIGEELAQEFIRSLGFEIVATNFQTRFGEIDIIAKFHHRLIFIEVKTKTSDLFGSPEDMITPNKIKKVLNMANVYLTKNKLHHFACRLDVIAITLDQNLQKKSLNHYESVEL